MTDTENKDNLYVVEMLRWGDREKHSYVVGVFDNLKQALDEGVANEIYRGGKYEFSVTSFKRNVHTTYSAELVTDYGEDNFTHHVTTRALDWTAETDGKFI